MQIAQSNYSTRMMQKSRGWLLKNILLPAGDFVLGDGMMSRLRFLQQAQWWDRERLHAARDRALASVIKTAYEEVPFYRTLMDRASVQPEDIRTAADLQRLPIVTKAMLKAGYPHLTCRKVKGRTYEASTSGSTGVNFRVLEDRATAGWYRASFLLALNWAGWDFGERHLQNGIALTRSLDKRLKDYLLGCYYVSAYDLTDAQLDRSLEMLDHHRIEHLWGYPGSLCYLAKRAMEKGWNRPLRSLVTWGDNLYPHYRKTIEAAFQTQVLDTYGCSEGIQISAQCGHGHAYHLHSLDVVVDFLDEKGNPVPAGQPGNLVLTRLHAGPMPLIRYQVGDVGVAAPEARVCACGRGFDLMLSIQGRDTDAVITPDGNRLIVHFFTGILEYFSEIGSFQVIQETIDHVVIRVVPTCEIGPENRQRIIAALQKKGLTGMRVEIQSVEEIPLTAGGKRRFVINKTLVSQQQGPV